jgi:hypothetical protein
MSTYVRVPMSFVAGGCGMRGNSDRCFTKGELGLDMIHTTALSMSSCIIVSMVHGSSFSRRGVGTLALVSGHALSC